MELADLLHGLSVRAPWLAAGRVLLVAAGFTPHRGYELTIRGALSEPDDAARAERLNGLLKEHLVAGEKLIRLYKLNRGERTKIKDWIEAKRKTANALTDAFPGVAPALVARSFANADPTSAGYLSLEVGPAALFTSIRSYLDKVPVPASKLKAGAADGYESIFAMKRVFVQTYDAIWLTGDEEYVCLAADLPRDAPSGFARPSQDALEVQLRRLLGRATSPVNLWPAVDNLYKANEGRLLAHGFVNNSDAVKHHTGRSGSKSLRDDAYDIAGAAAVGDDLLTFNIAIGWARTEKLSVKAQPELQLPGSSAHLQMPNARLEHAIVRNCLNTRDLSFVVSKLVAHL